jgi:integrase/recombinase XerD
MLRQKRIVPLRPPAPEPAVCNPLRAHQARFLTWTMAIGLSVQTASIRRAALDRFLGWCEVNGIEEASQVTRRALEDYQLFLAGRRKSNGDHLALSTQATRLHPVRAFCRWLARERLLSFDASADLVMPRLPRRLPRWVSSVAQVERVLAQPDVTRPAGIRDRAMLEVLYSTALRRMELVRLQVHDVDIVGGVVRVTAGKGGRDRVVPIGGRAISWLSAYLVEARPLMLPRHREETLFVTDYGEPFGKNRLGDLARRYFRKAGVVAPGACHLFRHACATHMLENGADIRFIQSMLGHADLSTTQVYTRVSIAKLRAVHAATHPAR